jgi:hypothetical protein
MIVPLISFNEKEKIHHQHERVCRQFQMRLSLTIERKAEEERANKKELSSREVPSHPLADFSQTTELCVGITYLFIADAEILVAAYSKWILPTSHVLFVKIRI